ncbi:bifunctional UDP-N-acetylglucosamine diphosphorylase/glucosamine-1-phosphate N-acetyltransferase GlmU [Aliiroseovarius sp. 2305UL8-7]|uniref:bifunctional UDP-N-acetylglucosamine diphosphorylase/glucosamine-1-phosphate N-acetyltransferase GlmU n=1 Tax=Aliiroseovarius conchicola TaxID=3121637 RepID=UPI003529765C
MATALIVLAAGRGTRMNSDLPKVMHQIAGAPLFAHALASGDALAPDRAVLVVGHGADLVEAAAKDIDPDITIAIQEEQLGTGHAVAQTRAALKDFKGDAIVLYGDTPFIQPETIEAMAAARTNGADVVVLGFEAADPGRYGRLILSDGELDRIVEFKDATAEEGAVTLCNSGLIAADAELLFDLLDEVGNDNATGEYYLPDIVSIARGRGLRASVVTCDESETLGINSRSELANAEEIFQANARAAALENGVTLIARDTVYFSFDTIVGRDTVIEPNVVFGPGVTVESGATIRAFSHLEGCHVSRGGVVGPYARLRPGAELAEHAKVGNFVEIKNAQIEEGAKVNHLSYVGDARVGEHANIGAGTITCNYDGVSKHHTDIGARSFIGSNTCLVAPVTVGDEAMTATGTVVTKDVPNGAMAVGRARMEVKPGLAVKLFEKLRAAKARRQKGS